MSTMTSPCANLILALLTVLVWLMKHHNQQEPESELLFHSLAVDDVFRYSIRHHQVAEGKRKVHVDIAANAAQPGSARPRRSGPSSIRRVYHLPGTGRRNLAVTETDTESSTNSTSRTLLARVFYVHRPYRKTTPPTRLRRPYNNGLPLPPTSLFPFATARTEKDKSPARLLAGILRPPPPQQLMDFGRNAAIRTSEAKSSLSHRPSGLPFSTASFTPWFRELWVNASK